MLMSIRVESRGTCISRSTVGSVDHLDVRCGHVIISLVDPVFWTDMSVTHPIHGKTWDWVVSVGDAEVSSRLLGDELRGSFITYARSAEGILGYIQESAYSSYLRISPLAITIHDLPMQMRSQSVLAWLRLKLQLLRPNCGPSLELKSLDLRPRLSSRPSTPLVQSLSMQSRTRGGRDSPNTDR